MDQHTKVTTARTSLVRVIVANGRFSLVSGGLTAAAAAPLGDAMELPPVLLVAIGLGLVGYGAALLVASRRRPVPRPVAWFATTGDLAWVLGAVVAVIIPGTMSGSGKALLSVVSVAVLGFAVAQVRSLASSAQ